MGNLIDLYDSNFFSIKLAAVNNNVRFAILEILRDFQKSNNVLTKNPLYSREINNILLNNYKIKITPQMLGQHLKQLVHAGLIDEVYVKKEVPNKIGRRNVKAYILAVDAFEDLFLDITFLSDELLTFFDLYKLNQKFNSDGNCVLTIFNGPDKGKTYKIHKNETILIGRKSDFDIKDIASFCILLDNRYTTVSKISKPHLKLFNENDVWYILDESSSNGTYIGDKKIPLGNKTRLMNNSFLKLSKGENSAVIYCSFN